MQSKMKSDVGRRAWNILRLALLWARKGGVFKRRLLMSMDFPKLLKALRHSTSNQRGALHYGERELSFDDTPIVRVKMHRPSSFRFRLPHIPCINPQVDFDYDFSCFNDDISYYNDYDGARKSFLKGGDEDVYDDCEVCEEVNVDECGGGGEEGIDLKAEQFIAKFYEQMKLQRQISYLEYK